jgi:hypothetical protein
MLAFTLSFFLPGAGLCYLGKWLWGMVNLLVVLGIGLAMVFLFNGAFEPYIKSLSYGLAGGSGGLAMALANLDKLKTEQNQNNQQSGSV